MPPQGRSEDSPVGVGAVGVRPGEYEGILAELPKGSQFRLVAFSDEGLAMSAGTEPGEASEWQASVPYYPDYNMLLNDPSVELVLVDGLVELRRDFAVRALNSGRHAVLAPPFCETALDAERVAKTAIHRRLLATMELKWREDADLRALRTALEAEQVEAVQGLFFFLHAPELPPGASSEPSLLRHLGLAVFDQLNLVLRQDVRNVSAHVQQTAPGGPEQGFLLYLPLRSGGWAACQASRHSVPGLPRWIAYAASATLAVGNGKATVLTGTQQRTYEPALVGSGFWQDLYAAIREGAPLACHPADIMRAMKLHEAAMQSAELGEPVTV